MLTLDGAPSVTAALTLGAVSVPFLLIGRSFVRRMAWRQEWYTQTALLVGSSSDCQRVRRTLDRHPEYGIAVAGELHARGSHAFEDEQTGALKNVPGLIAFVMREPVDRVIFAGSYEGLDERTGALRFLAERGVKVDLVPGDTDVFRSDAELHHIEGLPLLTLPNTSRARSAAAVKRALDVGAAGIALTVLSPLFMVAAAAIRLDTRGPVFFRQPRIGRHGEMFTVLKFRTMVNNAEQIKTDIAELNKRSDGMFKVPDDPRITRVGRFLRKFSLDELPQLINVLRGEMSLVGPRPLIEVESSQVSHHYRARFEVRPGITGPWQVLGRSDIPFEDMVKLDYTYVTNWTLGDDVKLMARTVSAMGGGRGAY